MHAERHTIKQNTMICTLFPQQATARPPLWTVHEAAQDLVVLVDGPPHFDAAVDEEQEAAAPQMLPSMGRWQSGVGLAE